MKIYFLTLFLTLSFGPFERKIEIKINYPFQSKRLCETAANSFIVRDIKTKKILTFDSFEYTCDISK